MSGNWKDELTKKTALAEQALQALLPEENTKPAVIHQAMRYSVFAGGKRLRPVLAMSACEAVGGSISAVLPAACALELIHTYSLIHDDLPALDDDDFRRGRLTNHKVYGEAIAILAGDALLTLAFEVLADFRRSGGPESIPSEQRLLIIREIAQAAGSLGMVGGQVADMQASDREITPEDLHYIHSQKTGALCRAAVRAGAIVGGADANRLAALTLYAEKFGLAFQITDDILDIEGDPAKTGKPVGSDTKNQKATFPAVYGLERSKALAGEAVSQAIDALSGFDARADLLRKLVGELLNREK